MKGLRHVLMDAATDGSAAGVATGAGGIGDGGAASGAGGNTPAAAGAAGDAGAAAAAAGTGASAGDGQGTALAAGAPPVTIPEKYQVKKEDGTLDVEASSLKLAEAYGHLEKRMGSGDVPPKTPEEYVVTVPDALKDTWKPAEDPLLQGFLKDAHAAGFTQKQIDLALGKYMEVAPGLVNGSKELSAEDCTATLKAEWKTDEQYKDGVGAAYKAAVGYFGSDADALIKEYGNDARFIRGLAKLGAEMGEDTSASAGTVVNGGTESYQEIFNSEAFNNPKHPGHAEASKKYKEYFDKNAEADIKAGRIAVM